MQTPKGLLDYKGHPWIVEQVGRFREAGGTEVIVVIGGEHAPLYRGVIAQYAGPSDFQVKWIENPDPKRGKFSSYQIGFGELIGHGGGFLSPIDVPMPRMEIWHDMVQAARSSQNWKCIMPVHQETGGHPVLLNRSFIDHLLTLPIDHPDSRLDRQIHLLNPDEVHRVQVHDPEITLNLNTPEAWRAYAFNKDTCRGDCPDRS